MKTIEQQLAHLPGVEKVPAKKHQYQFKNMVMKMHSDPSGFPLKKANGRKADALDIKLWDVWQVSKRTN